MKTLLAQGVDIGKEFNPPIEDPTGLGPLVSTLLSNTLVLAGILLLVLIIAGGFAFMTMGGDPEKLAQIKKAFTMLFIGFLLIFASFWIIRIIEAVTGVNILGG